MRHYPRSNRPVGERAKLITEEHRNVARQFGQEFFDGNRLFGYGGYKYDGRWKPVVQDFRDFYTLSDDAAILDVGCGKGFMMRDFIEMMPNATVKGIDISEYAVEHGDPIAKPHIQGANCKELPFPDDSFDLVISINTVHNLPIEACKQSLREIMRVTRKDTFVIVDAWTNEAGKRRMMAWNLTALTMMSGEDWEKLFDEVGYTGDYDWFAP